MTDSDRTDTDQPREEGGYDLDRRAIAAILEAVEADDQQSLIDLMEPLHAADIADLLEQIDSHDRARLIRLYGQEFDGEILSELEEGVREEVIGILHPQVLAEAVRELESDDVVDLVEDLEEPQKAVILGALEDADRDAVTRALSYPEGSAGRLMQRETVMAPQHWTVGETIDHLRAADELPDQFYHVILVDPRMHPVGNVTLGRLMASRRDVALSDIVEDMFRTIPVDQDEEDILLLAGVGEESALSDTVAETSRRRLPWLVVNMGTAIFASLVISQFAASIAQLVSLAILMPIVASMGGNAGTQSLTVTVRALATRDLTDANVWRVIRRELTVGLLNGLVFATVLGVIGMLWFHSPMLGAVIGMALVCNMIIAGFAGTVVPVVLDKVGVDPALASGTFVTTTTDVMGFFIFLGLASVILL